jgi:hypothetical protein
VRIPESRMVQIVNKKQSSRREQITDRTSKR